MTIKVAILFGGQSHEHPVSLMSVASVLANLPDHYDVYKVGITLDGKWYHFTGNNDEFDKDRWVDNPSNEEVILSSSPSHHGFFNVTTGKIDRVDVIMPILHGRGGEDGTVQGICQLAGIPCVSCDLTSSALAMDKEFTHIIAESYGVPMAKYKVYRQNERDYERMYEDCRRDLGIPCYVKPSKEGSSFGAHKINNFADFCKYLDDAFTYDNKILVEEFIPGTEVGCGVMGEETVGEVFEIVVETEMYGFEEKYDGYKTNIYCPAINLSEADMNQVKALSVVVYKALGCTVMGRADFFASDRIIFNEINLIPGFTSHSLYPTSFTHAGMTYAQILDNLIGIAMEGDK